MLTIDLGQYGTGCSLDLDLDAGTTSFDPPRPVRSRAKVESERGGRAARRLDVAPKIQAVVVRKTSLIPAARAFVEHVGKAQARKEGSGSEPYHRPSVTGRALHAAEDMKLGQALYRRHAEVASECCKFLGKSR